MSAATRKHRAARAGVILLGAAAVLAAGWWLSGAGRRATVRALPAAVDLSGLGLAAHQAVAAAERAARADGSAQGIGQLGMAYHANALDEPALAAYDLARRLAPGDPRWPYYSGLLALMAGDGARARADLEAALRLDPRLAAGWTRLGDLRYRSGDGAGAEQAYRQALVLAPADPHAAVGLARILGDRGDWGAAVRLLAPVVKESPMFGPGQRILALAYTALGRAAEARAHATAGAPVGLEPRDALAEALWAGSSTPGILVVQATIAGAWGDLPRAEALLRRAVALAPEDRDAHWALGRLLSHPARIDAARLSEARRQLEIARDLGPAHVNLDHEHATILAALGQTAAAVESWTAILHREPDHAMAHMSLGRAAEMRADHQAAMRHYERGLAVAPDTPYTLEERARGLRQYARACQQAGLPLRALEALERAVAEDPTFAPAWVDRAETLIGLGRVEEGLAVYAEAAGVLPEDPQLSQARAASLGRLERGRR